MSDEPLGLRVGDPEEWRDFDRRHPKLRESLPRLQRALEQAFLRRVESEEVAPCLIFGLGRLAVEDFSELLLLAMNGYGLGALKLLRPLYERVVTGLYLTCHPDRAVDFVDYAYVQQRKLINHAKASGTDVRRHATQEQLDEVEAEYQRVKGRFTEVVCEKCGTTQDQLSWTKRDLKTLADEVDLGRFYGTAAFWPTLQIHSTRTALDVRLEPSGSGALFKVGPQREQADHSVAHGHLCLVFMVEGYNRYFGWGLDTAALRGVGTPQQKRRWTRVERTQPVSLEQSEVRWLSVPSHRSVTGRGDLDGPRSGHRLREGLRRPRPLERG